MPEKLSPKSLAMNTIASTMETIIQTVFKVSVQITDLTPPRNVYSSTMPTEITTFRMNGSPSGSKIINWSVTQTRNSLTAAPRILEMKKNHAPALCEDTPNRSSRYW